MASKQELIVRKHIENLFPKFHILYNWRPDFLKNQKTGKNLEYDIYIGKFFLAIEYQGQVHFTRVDRYKNDPDKAKYHDELKNSLSLLNEKKALSIVEVFECDLNNKFKENLMIRIQNTIDYNTNNKLFENAFYLYKCLYYLKTGLLENPSLFCICETEYLKTKLFYQKLGKMLNVFNACKYLALKRYAEQNNVVEYMSYIV